MISKHFVCFVYQNLHYFQFKKLRFRLDLFYRLLHDKISIVVHFVKPLTSKYRFGLVSLVCFQGPFNKNAFSSDKDIS